MAKKILHIGYPKTASSTVQNYLSSQDGIYYLGKGWAGGARFIDDEMKRIFREEICEADDFAYNKDDAREVFQKHFDLAEGAGDKPVVVSSEDVLVPQGRPGFQVPVSQRIQRLADIFGSDTEIVIVLREQRSFLLSYYRESLKWGVNYTFDTFCRYLLLRKKYLILPQLNYARVIGFLKRYFDNVHVFLFEDFISNRETRETFFTLFNVPAPPELPKENIYNPLYSWGMYQANRIFRHREARGGVLDLNYEDILRYGWYDFKRFDKKGFRRERIRQEICRKITHTFAAMMDALSPIVPLSKSSTFFKAKEDVQFEIDRIILDYNKELAALLPSDTPLGQYRYI